MKTPIPTFSIFQRVWLIKNGIIKWEIPTHLTNTELIQLNKLAKTLAENSIALEIGSYLGASSLILAKGLPPNSKLYCVDTWGNHAMSEGQWETYERFIQNTKAVKEKISPIRAWSLEAAKKFDKKIDLLFLDGDHSYKGIKSDVDAWLPKLNSGGIVVVHDIGWADGVKKVVKEDIKPLVIKEGSLPNMYWAWIKN